MKQSHRPTAEAFERLCAPYSGMVYRHCLHMLGNPHEAEDAAQESMLRAFRAFDAFRATRWPPGCSASRTTPVWTS